MEAEWDQYIGRSAFKAAKTIQSHKNNHKRLTEYLERPLGETKPDHIIKAVESLAKNPNTRKSLLSTAIVFYNIAEKDIKKLNRFRDKLVVAAEAHSKEMASQKAGTLPSIEDLDNYLKQLYTTERWADFILNYLLMNYNTRNIDLDVEVVNSIHKTKADKKRNYLVVRKNDIVYIRYRYKTYKTYGTKRNIFKSILVERAIRRLREERGDKPLFLMSNKDGSRIMESSSSNYVKLRTLNNITEGDINKIYVSHYVDTGDIDALRLLSANRGTDLETLFTSYNIPQSLFPTA